jgi:hypothetical protein
MEAARIEANRDSAVRRALPPGAARRRAVFGLLDADGWAWAFWKALFWFLFIIFMLGVASNLVTIVIVMSASGARSGDVTAAMISGMFGMILPGLFAIISWRAYAAIPDYLQQPAWCQELIVKAKL